MHDAAERAVSVHPGQRAGCLVADLARCPGGGGRQARLLPQAGYGAVPGSPSWPAWLIVRAAEDGVADVADGVVEFVDGVVDLAGPAVLADQSQREVEI